MALRTLTQQQFQAARPGGSYKAYLGYLAAHRPAVTAPKVPPNKVVSRGAPGTMPPGSPTVRAPASVAPNPLTYAGLLARVGTTFETPAQLEARANRMAATSQKSQMEMLAADYKQSQDEAMRRMLAFSEAGRAAAAQNAGLIGMVGQGYQAGADQLAALAAAGSAGMGAATQSAVDAANAAGANVGAPAINPAAMAGPGQVGVENYRGGTLGAQMLTNAGGFAQAGQAGQISAQNLRATQEAQAAYMTAMRQATSDRSTAIAKLAAERPSTAADFLTKLQDAQRQNIALASSLIGAGATQKLNTKKVNASIAQQNQANKQWWAAYNQKGAQWQAEFDENQRQFNQKLQATADANRVEMGRIDASASRAYGWLVDKAGNVIKGADGKPIPVAQTGSSKGGLTAYQMTRILPKARDAAELGLYGYVFVDKNGNRVASGGKRIPAQEATGFNAADPTTWGTTGRLEWGQQLSRLKTMGLSGQAARAMLSEYYARGDKGRPVFLPEERAMLLRRMGKQKFGWVMTQILGMYKRNQVEEADAMIRDVLGYDPDVYGGWTGGAAGETYPAYGKAG